MRILSGRIFRCGVAPLLLAALLAGCSEVGETRHPLFQKGQKARREGDGATAAECFRKFLHRHPAAVQTHLELAGIYDELLDEPLLAAVHYRNYLELCPESPDAAAIRAWQLAAEQRFCEKWLKERRSAPENRAAADTADGANAGSDALAGRETSAAGPESSDGQPGAAGPESSGGQPGAAGPESSGGQKRPELSPAEGSDASELAALREENRRLRDFLADCKKEIALLTGENRRLRSLPGGVPETGPGSAADPSGGTVAEYTVQPGDTPGSIARKVYGSHRLYPEIMRANPGVGERSLRPGMVLRIPPRPETARGGKP